MPDTARAIALLAALALAGCAGDEGITGGGRVLGSTLTVYSVQPDPSHGAARDLVQGEKLALEDARGTAGGFGVNFASLDQGAGNPGQAAAAVRRAIADPQVIAVIADATPITVPLLNEAGILQVAAGGHPALGEQRRLTPSGRPTMLRPPTGGALPRDFARRFRAAFGRAPTREAERGYRAMRAVIDAVRRAGAHGNDRTAVIAAYRR